MKRCKDCIFYPDLCGYWKLKGKKDKGGNVIHLIKPDDINNCPDYFPIKKALINLIEVMK